MMLLTESTKFGTCRALKAELKSFQDAAAYQAEMDLEAARSKQLREEESKFEKPHPLEIYLDMLAASDEASLKEGLMGMGSATDVPKLFRINGKVNCCLPSYQEIQAKEDKECEACCRTQHVVTKSAAN